MPAREPIEPTGATRERAGSAFVRELLVFAAFAALTVLMTWPWVTHVRDAVSDPGDPYLNSWIMYWDFHQTFHDPLRLFDGNVFYPYRYSLAFSEHNYGIALLFFPFYALGLPPLTAHGLAILLGFTFSGYGAFRLARTLTGSAGAGWIAGIAFAFVPFRFYHIVHVNYLFAGWIPILLEALVLYLRAPSWKRAAWLGAAFLMNGLTCIHWLVLTLLPLALTFGFLLFRFRREKERTTLRMAAVAFAAASLLLAPFLLPYQRAAKLYGFVRGEAETLVYSAKLIHWLTADDKNRIWSGLGVSPPPFELALFPGLALLLLALAALLLARPDPDGAPAAGSPPPPRLALTLLDGAAVLTAVVMLLACSPAGFKPALFGHRLLSASDPTRAVVLLSLLLFVRWWLAYPRAFTFFREVSLRMSVRNGRRPEALAVGSIWAITGFFGSLGLNTPFHRFLYESVFFFRSIRAPARWAMVADVGLALLAGVGALLLARAASARFPRARSAGGVTLCAIGAAILFEDRVVPWNPMRGDVDPDAVTLRLKETPMRGGLVELPVTGPNGNCRYMLRAADHLKPLVNGISGFTPPLVDQLQRLTRHRPIADDLMSFLEKVPVSYLVVHEGWLEPEETGALHEFLARHLSAGRLRFVHRFPRPTRDDLYAVARTEPAAEAEPDVPWALFGLGALRGEREAPELLGGVDVPAEGVVVRGPELLVSGWARIPGEDLDVRILLDGELRKPVSTRRVPRLDVGAAIPGMGDVARTGYEMRYAASAGDDGNHELLTIFRAADGRVRHYAIRKFRWVTAPGGAS